MHISTLKIWIIQDLVLAFGKIYVETQVFLSDTTFLLVFFFLKIDIIL